MVPKDYECGYGWRFDIVSVVLYPHIVFMNYIIFPWHPNGNTIDERNGTFIIHDTNHNKNVKNNGNHKDFPVKIRIVGLLVVAMYLWNHPVTLENLPGDGK